MGSTKVQTSSRRWDSIEGELQMEKGHLPAWQAMILQIQERDLSGKRVLDFGCNRGGFLRTLYSQKPFKSGTGADIATDALEDARNLSKGIPVEFMTTPELSGREACFEIVFSHEVVYLLPDLAAHARDVYRWLSPGGAYYMAIGEYTENPLWPRWDNVVREFSPVPPQSYSLQYMAKTFQKNGFSVGVDRLRCEGFFDYDAMEGKYLQSPIELVEFMSRYMMYFRFEKI